MARGTAAQLAPTKVEHRVGQTEQVRPGRLQVATFHHYRCEALTDQSGHYRCEALTDQSGSGFQRLFEAPNRFAATEQPSRLERVGREQDSWRSECQVVFWPEHGKRLSPRGANHRIHDPGHLMAPQLCADRSQHPRVRNHPQLDCAQRKLLRQRPDLLAHYIRRNPIDAEPARPLSRQRGGNRQGLSTQFSNREGIRNQSSLPGGLEARQGQHRWRGSQLHLLISRAL